MFLQNISNYSVLLPLLVGVVFYVKFKKDIFIFRFVLLCNVIQFIINILSEFNLNNLWFFNLTHLLVANYIGYVVVYYTNPTFKKKYFQFIIFYSAIIVIANTTLGWLTFNKISYLLNNLFIVSCSFIGLLLLLKKHKNGELLHQPITWILFGSVFQYSLSSLIFSSLDIGLVDNNEQLTYIYLTIHPYINIFTNLVYTFAFIYPWKKQISNS